MKDYWLNRVCEALGWQGGTIHQVVEEIERRRQTEQTLRDLLEQARNGLQWYRDMHPEDDSQADDELYAKIDAALAGQSGATA